MSEIPIKSVRRIFEILQLFDLERKGLSAKSVADKLEYPLMSTHELLKSMHHLGYADYDAARRLYAPSHNIAKLVDWTRDFLDRETAVLDFIMAVNRETRETINLSRLTNDHVKIIHGLETPQPVGVSVKVGTEMAAVGSLTGMCALACLDQDEFDDFLSRFNKKHLGAGVLNRVRFKKIRDELAEFGTAFRADLFIEGIGAVCLPVRAKTTHEPLVIGVVGPSERIKRAHRAHRATLKRIISSFDVTPVWKLRTPPAD